MSVPPREGWFHRWPRPFIMWGGVVCGLLITAFFIVIGFAIATVYLKAADRMTSVPDMSGGIAAIISAVAVLIPAIISAIRVADQRHVERRDHIRAGTAPSDPFDPSTPPPEQWPRPGENSQ